MPSFSFIYDSIALIEDLNLHRFHAIFFRVVGILRDLFECSEHGVFVAGLRETRKVILGLAESPQNTLGPKAVNVRSTRVIDCGFQHSFNDR